MERNTRFCLHLACLALLAQDVCGFQPNCTLPGTTIPHVSSPNVRGTTDILWSSLATIFACTYSVLHLNVPEQRLGRDPGWKGDLRWGLSRSRKSVKWALITVIAPEWTMFDAVMGWWYSRKVLPQFNHALSKQTQTWTLTHMFYANMGGFVVEYNTAQDQASVWHLTSKTLLEGINAGVFPPNPPISAEELADRSKSDWFAKAIALLQIGYFVVGTIARRSESLLISQLEVGVSGFVACSVFTYTFCLWKPKSVTTTSTIVHYEGAIAGDVRELLSRSPNKTGSRSINLNTSREIGGISFSQSVVGTAALLGAIHIAGWNLDFPSAADKWVWRISALVSAVALAILWLSAFLGNTMHWVSDGVSMGVFCLSMTCYTLARLALLVEMFHCLAYLPPGAFTATWTANLPHLG